LLVPPLEAVALAPGFRPEFPDSAACVPVRLSSTAGCLFRPDEYVLPKLLKELPMELPEELPNEEVFLGLEDEKELA